jgi:hypothetical protein
MVAPSDGNMCSASGMGFSCCSISSATAFADANSSKLRKIKYHVAVLFSNVYLVLTDGLYAPNLL